MGAGLALLSWFDRPEIPLEELLGTEEATEPPAAAGDAEQEAFRERRESGSSALDSLAQLEEADDPAGVTLTDRDAVHHLAGSWVFDLGRRRLPVELAPVAVDRVRRGALLVELFPAAGPSLPAYFTVLRLEGKGTFLVFRDLAGDYQLVLEDLRLEGPDRVSYRYRDSRRRLEARRVRGLEPPSPEDREEARRPETSPIGPRVIRPERRGADESVKITVEPPPPASEMWRRARRLREEKRFDSLAAYLDRMLDLHPTHTGARRWRARTDAWIRNQRKDLVDDVEDLLEELEEAIEDRDLDDVFETWDENPDGATRRYFTDLFERYEDLDARIALHSVSTRDGVAEFSATLTLEATSGRRDRDIQSHRWNGRLQGGHFATPFP